MDLRTAQLEPDTRDPLPLEIDIIDKSPIPPEMESEIEAPPTGNVPTHPNLPTQKRYHWIPNSESETTQEIIGDIDPQNIVELMFLNASNTMPT
ncbi:hypothetical protein O181_066412 [Austropuccinia psidii MF-1]|uniref:Uncharacterized protein n=1 Tax=Austropuccinia psidii MF-1 TaxID=1389203 RepID=A0A9Q3EZ28_9BASI|nr:hypothetical protein [Austropuccinia psidii MF-1]